MTLSTYRLGFCCWLSKNLATSQQIGARTKTLLAVLIFVVSFCVRSLQAVDIEPMMHTPEQPGAGMSREFDSFAISMAAGQGILMPNIRDKSDTSLLAVAPGYPIFLNAVYRTKVRSFFTVQFVQNLLNSISPVLIFLIAGHLVSWRVGLASGLIAAVNHHLSHYSNLILGDALCALPILIAMYVLVRAGFRGRGRMWAYALAGLFIGIGCWIRPNFLLLGPLVAALLVLLEGFNRRTVLNGLLVISISFLTIAPITIRNYLLYEEFVPIRIGFGIVLWEGLGDASGGRFGALRDEDVTAQEVVLYGNQRYGESWSTPDGIKRDRDRVSRSLNVIKEHPVWYLGSVFGRMAGMLNDTADAPLVFRRNDTRLVETLTQARAQNPNSDRRREDPESIDRSALAFGRSIWWLRGPARAFQRITKETGLLFIVIGFAAFLFAAPRRTLIISLIPLYFFLFQPVMHTEFRYTLTMRYFLFIFAGVVWTLLMSAMITIVKKAVTVSLKPAQHSIG